MLSRCNVQIKEVWPKFLVGFLDGTSKNKVYGNWAYIVMNRGTFFHFNQYNGVGQNNRVDLISLWGVLICAKWLDIRELDVFGYSKVIIYWVQMRFNFGPPSLTHWMHRIRKLFSELFRDYPSHTSLGSKTMCRNSYIRKDVVMCLV